PCARGLGGDELEAERAHAPASGIRDGRDVRARYPQRWMRLLEWLRDDVARREIEMRSVPLPRVLRECRDDRLHGFFPHLTLVTHALTERMQLNRPLRFTEPELHTPARQQIERRDALGHADRVVGGELHHAVAEPDALRALARGAEKDFGRRAVRV